MRNQPGRRIIRASFDGWIALFLAALLMIAAGALFSGYDAGILSAHAPRAFEENALLSVEDGGVRLNVNRAGEDLLRALPGIGEARAAAIVAHREAFGAFASADDLLDVFGIGEKTLEGLREWIFAGE